MLSNVELFSNFYKIPPSKELNYIGSQSPTPFFSFVTQKKKIRYEIGRELQAWHEIHLKQFVKKFTVHETLLEIDTK
jgi:hypothetical protein